MGYVRLFTYLNVTNCYHTNLFQIIPQNKLQHSDIVLFHDSCFLFSTLAAKWLKCPSLVLKCLLWKAQNQLTHLQFWTSCPQLRLQWELLSEQLLIRTPRTHCAAAEHLVWMFMYEHDVWSEASLHMLLDAEWRLRECMAVQICCCCTPEAESSAQQCELYIWLWRNHNNLIAWVKSQWAKSIFLKMLIN